jgi:hypothetical protein
MKTIKISLIALLVGISSLLFGQNNTGEIKGKVFEFDTGDPLPLASVYVKIGEQLIGTTTDFEGNFTLKPLKPGVYNLSISHTGVKKVIEGIEVNPEKITYIDDFQFNNMLDIVEVFTWKRKLIDKGNPSIESIGMQEIQQSVLLRNPVELISVTVPGVSMDANGGVSIRGSRTGDVGYYVDGVKTSSLSGIPGRAIGHMSVYTGGVPAQYGDITGGVIIVETVSYFDLYNAQKAKENR